MLENLPEYISIVFGFTTIATLILFFIVIVNSKERSTKRKANTIIVFLTLWLIVQMLLSFYGFYNSNTLSFPPRFLLLILPPLITIAILFITSRGRSFIDSLPLLQLTNLNIVRIPVEVVLYWLFINNSIPELMTFTGRNFDILSGITAPVIAYWGFQKKIIGRKTILIWNIIALGLLLNIVINAIFSVPFIFQKFAFDQPNIAVLYFPFSWLPAFIVPVVMFGHLTSIRQLIKKNSKMDYQSQ